MADRVIYKGGQTVSVNTGDGIQLIRPKRGSLSKFPRWWDKKPGAYIDCAIFRVKLENGFYVRLVVPATDRMTLEIRHDGFGNFTFPAARVERIGIISNDSLDLLVEYQFPKISGGKVLKRTISPLPPFPPAPAPQTPEAKFPRRPSVTKRRKNAVIKVRARDEDGQYISDDPSTPEVDEAWIEKPAFPTAQSDS
jgi:hypothetical protein